MKQGSMIKEFNIDSELQAIAEKITEHNLNYGGALFQYNETNEDFVITVTQANFMHDLKEENARLTELAAQKASRCDELYEQLTSLFERVSGCSVSEFEESQLPYLADMIEGQMDADEACINKLKSKINNEGSGHE